MYQAEPLVVAWLKPGVTQIGIGQNAQILTGLSDAEQKLLDALRTGLKPRNWNEKAKKLGISKARADYLKEQVRRSRPRPTPAANPLKVVFFGLGPVSLLLAKWIGPQSAFLAAAVPDSHCPDQQRWLPDFYELGILSNSVSQADVIVVERPFTLEANLVRQIAELEVPYLPILHQAGTTQVGPWLETSQGPCWQCLQLFETDKNSFWPLFQAQLPAQVPVAPSALTVVQAGASGAKALANFPQQSPTRWQISDCGPNQQEQFPAPHPACDRHLLQLLA